MTKYRKVLDEIINVFSTDRGFRTVHHSVATYEQTNYYTIFLHSIKSYQYPQAYKFSAGVIIILAGGVGSKILFVEKISQYRKLSDSAENEPVHIFIH